MDNFISLDVETANYNKGSICQIGLAFFKDGHFSHSISQLICPEEDFYTQNIEIHGIRPEDVVNAPTFKEYYPELRAHLAQKVITSHTLFDLQAFDKAFEKYDLQKIPCVWLDTTKVIRKTWKQFARRGYGLGKISVYLNIEFLHHDAEEDAKASGIVLLKALEKSERPLTYWLKECRAQQIL